MKLKYLRRQPSKEGLVCNLSMFYGYSSTVVLGEYNVHDDSGNGYDGKTASTPVPQYPGFAHKTAGNVGINIGTGPTSVKTTALWIKPNDVAGTDSLIQLNGTDYLTVVTGTLTASIGGFLGGVSVKYVDGVAGTTLTANWHHIAITDTSAKNASVCRTGDVNSATLDGSIADIRLYDRVLTADEMKSLYDLTKCRYS